VEHGGVIGSTATTRSSSSNHTRSRENRISFVQIGCLPAAGHSRSRPSPVGAARRASPVARSCGVVAVSTRRVPPGAASSITGRVGANSSRFQAMYAITAVPIPAPASQRTGPKRRRCLLVSVSNTEPMRSNLDAESRSRTASVRVHGGALVEADTAMPLEAEADRVRR
jgi:hypothetical protein